MTGPFQLFILYNYWG